MTPADWRRFINDHVFLWPNYRDALRLRAFEAARDQVILAYQTASLTRHGVAMIGCRFNNGMIDRSPPGRRRLRRVDDYQPLGNSPGVREIAVRDGIPPAIPFTLAG